MDFIHPIIISGLIDRIFGWDMAIEDYTAALRLKPDYAFSLNTRGVA